MQWRSSRRRGEIGIHRLLEICLLFDFSFEFLWKHRWMISLYGQRKAGRLERAGQEGLGYPPRAAWSLAVFGMKGLKRVRGG
jgi:hypothetical protein